MFLCFSGLTFKLKFNSFSSDYKNSYMIILKNSNNTETYNEKVKIAQNHRHKNLHYLEKYLFRYILSHTYTVCTCVYFFIHSMHSTILTPE